MVVILSLLQDPLYLVLVFVFNVVENARFTVLGLVVKLVCHFLSLSFLQFSLSVKIVLFVLVNFGLRCLLIEYIFKMVSPCVFRFLPRFATF